MRRSILGAWVLLAACSKTNEYVPPPPAVVTVASPARRDVVEYAEFTGTTEPHKVVEIRARVKGFLAVISYQPGALVEKDAVLFQIDPAEYRAAVESAEADLRSTQADLAAAQTAIRAARAATSLADTAVTKLEHAYEARAVSEILVLETKAKKEVAEAELENAIAQRDVAKARVGVSEAKLVRAKLDLDWTTIHAPMGGRVAMWNVEVGGLVGPGAETLLTTIINDEKIFAHFDVAERWILEARKGLEERAGRDATIRDMRVELALVHEEGYPHMGRGDYVEPTVDASTGTLRTRAVFDNAGREIPGGSFVRVRFPIALRKGALLVTERALGQDQAGSFLLVVDLENKVERRDVKLGSKEGGDVVVLEGLEEGDRVIVEGLQRARPGATVKAESGK